MRRLIAVLCLGTIFLAAFFPGVAVVFATLPQLCELTFGDAAPRRIVRNPSVSPALHVLVVSHHLPRASLLEARS